MSETEKFKGLVAAPFTPMDKSGNYNPGIVPEYYSMLEKNGVSAAFINGSTGEGASMTQKEKQQNTEKWSGCFRVGGKVRIINLVGGTSYHECIENAVHSVEQGVSAIALLPPYYFKPSSEGYLAEFITKVGEAVPAIPVFYYHIPVLTGVYFPMIVLLEKISGMLPNFAGIKFTHEDLMDFLSCINYGNGRFQMLWGRDECMLSALVLGTQGFVGSTYNYAAPLYHKLIKAYTDGRLTEAREIQQKSIDMIRLLGKYGGMATGKAFMRHIGIDCGNFRLPLKNMSEENYTEFVKDVKALGMDELFSRKQYKS